MTLKRFSIALVAASLVIVSKNGVAAGQTPEAEDFS